MYNETPTVGQTSGFRPRDIHTKFPKKSLGIDMVNTSTHIGYFPTNIREVFNIPKKKYKFIKPVTETKLCPKCYHPMQLIVRKKGDIETGKGAVVGYTCNRGGTGCQDAKAKRFVREQKVKKFLSRTSPKSKHVKGVQLDGTMIRA